jgi:hypothetical protein
MMKPKLNLFKEETHLTHLHRLILKWRQAFWIPWSDTCLLKEYAHFSLKFEKQSFIFGKDCAKLVAPLWTLGYWRWWRSVLYKVVKKETYKLGTKTYRSYNIFSKFVQFILTKAIFYLDVRKNQNPKTQNDIVHQNLGTTFLTHNYFIH